MAEVLVLGANGGREQALAQAMEASPEVDRVVVEANVTAGLEAFSGSTEKPFVIIGPEKPLVEGLADELRDDGYVVFGATKKAAQYEASKSLAIKMAREAGIVHPYTYIAEGENLAAKARLYVEDNAPASYVIKADGLDGGKGVVLPDTVEEARETVEAMLAGEFSGAGKEIINFQARSSGPEVSAMVVVGEGKNDFVILPLSQDHKRLQDGDKGSNTGGMGAYATVPESIVNAAQYQKIQEKAYASLAGMEAQGVTYKNAVLYMGLMMSPEVADDSNLIEYNARFGDPETQAILPLVQKAGVDIYRLLRSAAEGSIEHPTVDFANIGYSALSVCLAASGYPKSPIKGDTIKGLDRDYEGVSVQLAGVETRDNGRIATTGGRVLYVTGVGETIDQAAAHAYNAIGPDAINFPGYQYRKDIGWQARTS